MEIMKLYVRVKLIITYLLTLLFGKNIEDTVELHEEECEADSSTSSSDRDGDEWDKISSGEDDGSDNNDDDDNDDVELDVRGMDTSEDTVNNKPVKMLCDICCSDNTEKEAVAFCVKCLEHLCESCNQYHSKFKITKNHKVITEDIPVDISMYESMDKLISCSKHPQFDISHFCHKHRMNLCLSCVAEAHRDCSYLQNLSELVPVIRDKKEEIFTNMNLNQQSISTHITRCMNNLENINMEKEDILHSVAQQANSLIDDVLLMRSNAEAEINCVVDEASKSLQDDIDMCKKIEKEEANDMELVRFLSTHNDASDSRTILQAICCNTRAHKDNLSCLKTKPRCLQFIRNQLEFNLDSFGYAKVYLADEHKCGLLVVIPIEEHLLDGIRSVKRSIFHEGCANTTHVGNVSLESQAELVLVPKSAGLESSNNSPNVSQIDSSTRHDPSQLPSLKCCNNTPVYIQQLIQRPSLYLHMNYNDCIDVHYVKHTDDVSECSITKCVALESGSICLVDESNKKLKKFDPSFTRCMHVKLEATVTDICNPKGEEVTILYNDLHKLSVVDTSMASDCMSSASKQNVCLPNFHAFKCITVDKQNEHYILLYETSLLFEKYIIEIRNYLGTILNSIPLNHLVGTNIGVPPSSMVNCLICSTHKGLVLVGEGLGVRRIALDLNKLKGKRHLMPKFCKTLYSDHKGLECLVHLACDRKGNVYTCTNTDDGSIYEFMSSRCYQPKLIAAGINGPTFIGSIGERKVLVCFKKGDCVHVYNLKEFD